MSWVRYEGFPLAVFLYHIKCYIVGYYVGVSGQICFSWALSAFLFCRISLASFSSGSIVLVLLVGFLQSSYTRIACVTSPGSLAVVLVFPSVFFMRGFPLSCLGYTSNGHLV